MRRFLVLLAAVLLAGIPTSAVAATHADPAPIVGGVNATEPYSFVASLQTLNGDHFCGAALIRSQWLYTAKHCVEDEGPGTFQARIGSNNRTSGGVVARSSQVVLNPDQASDAALVKLTTPVGGGHIQLASSTPVGSAVRLLGWGAVTDPEPSPPPTVLQQLDTDIRPDSQCGTDQWELCVGNPSGWKGACYGDSGGPAIFKVGGVWQLAGGTHAGTSAVCGQGPSIYTDTAYLRSWVQSVVGSEEPGGRKEFETLTDVPIPDLGRAVAPLTVSGTNGRVPATLDIDLRIVHTYRGDLAVELVAPDGSVHPVVAPSTNDAGDNIEGVFTVTIANGSNANGTWKLRVTDRAGEDTGYIDRWRLRWFD